jgi:hypothetical protein
MPNATVNTLHLTAKYTKKMKKYSKKQICTFKLTIAGLHICWSFKLCIQLACTLCNDITNLIYLQENKYIYIVSKMLL